MIRGGSRRSLAGLVLAVAAAGLCFGLRSGDPAAADPPVQAARAAWLRASASAADASLADLAVLLEAAVADGRRGAALAVAGTDPPGPPLEAAAARLEQGTDAVDAAQRARDSVAGVVQAVGPTLGVPELAADRAAVLGIATQLRAAAGAATVFVGRRHASEAVLQALSDAIAALARDDPRAALDKVDQARSALDPLTNWSQPPGALVVWLQTTNELIDATAAIAAATVVHDARALAEARARYAEASQAARQADAALAIALAEGGAAATDVPLRRLAELLASVAEVRAALAPLATGS